MTNMPSDRHTGWQTSRDKRKVRHLNKRVTYIIVTDGEKTEENYFKGLEASLHEGTPISVKIKTGIKTKKLIEQCKIIQGGIIFPDYNPTNIWIVFDRDRVQNFDEIISEAKRNKFGVAWSNPCIEEWFWAYFDELRSHNDSVTTNNLFEVLFMTKTERGYDKNLPDIYNILHSKGDEEQAIRRADNKLRCYESEGITNPSEMYSASTIF